MELRKILEEIEYRDPDGGFRQPMAEDYEWHRQWAVVTYGKQAWDVYSKGGWGELDSV